MEHLFLEIGPRLVIQEEHWYFHGLVELVFIFFSWNYLDTPSQFHTVHWAAHSCLCQPSYMIFTATFCNKVDFIYQI